MPANHLQDNRIRLIGRSSALSLLQLHIVKDRIHTLMPELLVDIITRSSTGDALQNIPLHTVEGSDFFTRGIFDALANGEADIAVHSLKDMSSEHFFGENLFAVVDRDDTRDIAIFNADIETKIRNGEKIIIGTCSPRREEMAVVFLKKALPQLHKEIKIETKPIRGNVETRLKKLDSGDYDATILATAGLNRLLRGENRLRDEIPSTVVTPSTVLNPEGGLIKNLLSNKKLMLLPLIECVPAPCQGAVVAEADPSNTKAVAILELINNKALFEDCVKEKKEGLKYGAGCIQQFGVTTISTSLHKYLYAAGRDTEGTEFIKWTGLPDEKEYSGKLFSSTNVMKEFFEYEWNEKPFATQKPVVFVANYKALAKGRADLLPHKSATQQEPGYAPQLVNKKIIASGTKTWLELAKQGYWVTASADALGFENLLPVLEMPVLNIAVKDIVILTHDTAAVRWKDKGYDAVSLYALKPKYNEAIGQQIAEADLLFWSSFAQYEIYGSLVKPGVKHLCCSGETAVLLKQAGIEPVIFPTIKAFEQWRKSSTRLHSVA